MPRRPASKTAPDPADVPDELLAAAPAELADADRWVAVHATGATAVAAVAHDVELRECRFTGVDLAARDLRGLQARDVRFDGCDLSGAILDAASLQRVEFVGCRMTGVMVTDAELRDVVLRDCRADLANWRMTSASHVLAVSTSLREADFYDGRLTNSAFVRCDLREATFRDAGGLAGATIDPDQVIPLALALLAAQRIAVTDTPRLSPGDDRDDGDG